jgi:SAM-dependent methyltransferase
MWRIAEVFASMEGMADAELDEGCEAACDANEHSATETTIMALLARRNIPTIMANLGIKKPRKVHAAPQLNNFGRAFFSKFYLNPATRVITPAEMRARAALIAGALQHCEIPVRSILDAGCGIGLLRKPFARAWPKARYTGLEVSAYLCRRYGFTQGSIADYRARRPFDLVVCYDVLQYLSDEEAAASIANFAKLTRAALYFSALTTKDWRENCDRNRTDGAVRIRPGDWYRRRLRKSFRYIGFGVWLRKDVTAILWDLEQP